MTEPASMSLAGTGRRSNFAAAIAKIAVPVPMSSGWRIGLRCASAASAIRHPRVEGCSPVPKAVAASSMMPMAPAGAGPR